MRWLFPIIGLLALIWYLVRVIPNPGRATYPCQRVAFPVASSFVVWLIGAIGSMVAFRKAKHYFVRSRYLVGIICIAVGIGAALMAISEVNEHRALADAPNPNDPIGVARGIYPGRVVWVHDPNATDWDGPGMGDGHWWQSGNTNMTVVDYMMSQAIRALVSEGNSPEAWDKIFRYFNQTHGKGDVGYRVGEKITIKVNLVGCIGVGSWGGVDPDTYDLVSKMDYMNTSPQMMLALLRQLINIVGAHQVDISIGDTLSYFPNQYYDMCHNEFPDVKYLDYEGKFGRTPVKLSSVPLYWSNHPSGVSQDNVPESYAQADYIINMANFKSHNMAAVTFCGKNHYGSLIRWPGQSGYYNLHIDLPSVRDGMGYYRNLVDLIGHAHIGGKTLLYLIDGLYGGHHPTDDWPTRLNSAPFNGDWSSSLFVSQDPVAIDSVAFDFLWAEPGWGGITQISGGEDYLHEAAQANNPPSGTYYDPDHSGDVTRLASLGVHEHWNNPIEKQYSRNLGTGDGIELILAEIPELPTVTTTAVSNITQSSAMSGGNVTSDGGARVTAKGVCWSTTTNPTTANSKTTDGTGTGVFASALTGLTPGTPYHVRAYATNSGGTGYGADVTFTAASSATLYVSSNGQCGQEPCYSTIQAALDAAEAGAIIKVADGNYLEAPEWKGLGKVAISGGYRASFTEQTGTTQIYAPRATGGGSISLQPRTRVIPRP